MEFRRISFAAALLASSFGCAARTGYASDDSGESGTSESESGASEAETGEPGPPTMLLEATQVATGALSVCAEALDGRLVCWGDNELGQLGDGTLTGHTYPVEIDLSGIAQLELKWQQSCARTDAGRVYCWGDGEYGQLGDGVAEDDHARLVPTEVPGLVDVVDLSISGQTTCVVLGDGSVWCWGANESEVLGFPSGSCGPYVDPSFGYEYDRPCAPEPVQVPGVVDAVEVVTDGTHQCARHHDGSVSCWGYDNEFGTLGDGTTMSGPAVRSVVGLADVISLGAGNLATCALVADGSVWCWGFNGVGMLGVGIDPSMLLGASTPMQVPGLADVTQLSVNDGCACAVTASGEAWCWGSADYLRPPDRYPTSTYISPIEVDLGVPAIDIDSSGLTTCILDADSHVRCIGRDTGNGDEPLLDFSGDPVLWDG